MLTAGLEVLGVSLGPDLMPPDSSDNPKGYFENPNVVALNDRLLALDGHHWASLGYGVDIDYTARRYDELRGAAEQAIAELSSRARGPVALKDPRICLTLPFWLSVIERVVGPDIFGLMILRHPVEVAASLKARSTRGEWRKVMAYTQGDEVQSVLLWLSYIHHALHHVAGRPLRIVTQDSLLRQPRQELEATADFLGLTPDADALESYASGFVDPTLTHHRELAKKTADITPHLAFVDELWPALAALDGQVLTETDRQHAIGAFPPMEFAYTYSAQSAPFIAARQESLELADSLEEARIQNAQLRDALEEERRNVRSWEHQSDKLKDELRAAYARVSELDALAQSQTRERLRAEEQRAQAERQRDVAERQRDVADQEMWRMRATLSWRLTRPLRDASRRKALIKRSLQQGYLRLREPIEVLVPAAGGRTVSGDRELEFAIERIIFAHGRIHGWGWIFSRRCTITSLDFGAEGDERTTRAVYGLDRPDVTEAFPETSLMGPTGFMLNGLLPQDTQHILVRAFCADSDDPVAVLRVDLGQHRASDRSPVRYVNLLRTATGHVIRGDVGGLARRIRNQHAIAHLLQRKLAPSQLLERLGKCDTPVTVVIDHNLGGGANAYRDRLSKEWIAEDVPVLVIYFNLSTLDYVVELHQRDGDLAGRIESLDFLDEAVDRRHVGRIFYNNAVSFPDPVALVDQLTAIAEAGTVPVHFAVHDYFAVCPSWTLLNYRGQYCGVPDPGTCDQCLAKHEGDAFTLVPKVPIAVWREAWGRLLASSERLLFYSQASREIVQRAYPDLAGTRMNVEPHRVDYLGSVPRRNRISQALHVGIVGAITLQKGAGIVEDLSRLLADTDPDAKITVFGTLDGATPRDNLSTTGEYVTNRLSDMIGESGASVFLFPSIWPETFSYVTGELMAMELPIVAFDLGAPAERLKHYDNAALVEEVSASALVPALYRMHRRQQDQYVHSNRKS